MTAVGRQFLLVLALVVSSASWASGKDGRHLHQTQNETRELPGPPASCSDNIIRGIKWGVATSAYQTEGAYTEGGRTPSIWDTYTHRTGKETGDVAADMYHRYPEDFKLMQELGIKHYRFSISWNRIVPQAFANTPINQEGVNFYNDMINTMMAHGITPYVAMFHFDMPQALQDAYGGFTSSRIADDFAYYADALFSNFGDRVKNWMTINEPRAFCELHYGSGQFGGIPAGGNYGQFHCGHNALLAHGRAVQLYRSKGQGGRISIILDVWWAEPMDANNPDDQRGANNFLQNQLGWFADPIYLGDYPESLKGYTADLPAFTEAERSLVKGSADFLAINSYTSRYMNGYTPSTTDREGNIIGPQAESGWLYDVPWGQYKLIKYANNRYNPGDIWITENGWSQKGEVGQNPGLTDTERINYFKGYIDSVCRAKSEGAPITHYFAWSFIDNFEWNQGYTVKFGIVRVDYYREPKLQRSVKDSAYWLSNNFFKKSA